MQALALSVFRVLWRLVRVSGRQLHQTSMLLALEAVFGGLVCRFVFVFFVRSVHGLVFLFFLCRLVLAFIFCRAFGHAVGCIRCILCAVVQISVNG